MKGLTWKIKLALAAGLIFLFVVTNLASYTIGLNKGKEISKTEIARYETRITELQNKAIKGQVVINDRVRTVYVDREKVITETKIINRDVIQNNVVSRPQTLSNGWVYSYNQSVQGLEIDAQRAANDIESGVKDVDALQTLNTNNATTRLCMAKVAGWEQWHAETKKMYDEFTAKKSEKK